MDLKMRDMFNFLNCTYELSSHLVDEVQKGESPPLVKLQTNMIPNGFVPLEKSFENFDIFKGTNNYKLNEHGIQVNIGSMESPEIIKIGQGHTQVERRIEFLVLEYKDIFSWYYYELEAYDPKVIEHEIPLRKETKPFRQ
jgi:hypothetical protein